MISSQMLKGTLEGCLLRVIASKETYGYEICQTLRRCGFTELSEGTIYPLLLRLERSGLIQAVYQDSPVGPKRKVFSITPEGTAELAAFVARWEELEQAVHRVFNEEEAV